MNGEQLWRINLGKNIRAGAHYTQFMVYDLDGDGKAEVVMRTADGTVDGKGKVIGNADADYREAGTFDPSRNQMMKQGRILKGKEYLTVFQETPVKPYIPSTISLPAQRCRLGRRKR